VLKAARDPGWKPCPFTYLLLARRGFGLGLLLPLRLSATAARMRSFEDPAGLFNSSLEGNVRRASDIGAGDKVDEAAL